MNDLKHLREVLTEAYPREELSLDALARVVAALDGLPAAALDGGWTFKGFTAWAQGLEAEIAMLKAEIESSPSVDEWNILRATQCDCTTKTSADGVQMTFCSSAQMARARAVSPLSEFRRMQIIGDEFPLPLVTPEVIAKMDSVCVAVERAHGIRNV